MTTAVSPAIAALFDQATNLTIEVALTLAEQYRGQVFKRASWRANEKIYVTTDHGRMVAEARLEAQSVLPASRASTLVHARDVIIRRQVELIDKMRMDDPRGPDFRPGPYVLFADAVLAELVADRPGVSQGSIELLRRDWRAVVG
jgi:hypothetical protein